MHPPSAVEETSQPIMSTREKLPIYPAPPPLITLIETPHPLEAHVRTAREHTSAALGGVREKVQAGVEKWVGWEGVVEREIKSVLPRDEPLTPGILYVGVAGLAGSVFARNRNILLRLTLPPALFLLSAPYFLPKTSANVRAYLARVEDAHFPELAAQHDALLRSVRDNLRGAESSAKTWTSSARDGAGRVVKGVEDTTGLRLGEVMGRAREIEEKVVREVERERAGREESAKRDGEVVGVVMEETPVAEIVAVKDAAQASPAKADKAEKKRLV